MITIYEAKDFGEYLVHELLAVLFFEIICKKTVELNVFDFNTGAIKCYEKVGFEINPDKKLSFSFYGKKWNTINMVISKESWHAKNT